ncbi:GNAT family N-acetyltransferase [Methylophaga sulfidovorans]|uniref:Ribosomal protein S18 acetylase RimI n=1 Tax=Methylophaga sulfidovorans TaxID=45496 RepID=A0A1I4CE73_9GAMM|nr:GNAT family N-acetyltransferase [Methylophaga sulfidovorans]SFK78311.1 Ribosomal protein S18 acetylase RimI [Methylophaga sulfidovorans]
MNIREASIDDAIKIKDLVSSLSHFYFEDDNSILPSWFSDTLVISEFENRLKSDDFTNLVYILNEEIVGYISIKGSSHIYHLFVAENHQGKGISKELWNRVISTSGVDTYTVRSSIFAVPVYKSFGFKISGEMASKDGIKFQPMELVC